MKIYALRSKSLEHLNLPFYAENDKAALAMVRDQVRSDPDSSLSRCLDDLQLCLLGRFSNETGICGNQPFVYIDFDLSIFHAKEE